MAKRFTDTKIWSKEWFRRLSPRQKELWRYLCDNCDGFGIWDIDFGTASHFIGEAVCEDDLLEFGPRVVNLRGSKLWIPRWLPWHYKTFRATSRVHLAVASKVLELVQGVDIPLEAQKVIDDLNRILMVTPNQGLLDPWLGDTGKRKKEKGKGKEEKGKGKEEKGKEEEEESGAEISELPRHAPSPAPGPCYREDVLECVAEWKRTLARFKADRPLRPEEEIEIARKVKEVGKEFVLLALLGARNEKSSENFKPSEYLRLSRVFRPDDKPTVSVGGTPQPPKAGFMHFVNLGAIARNKAEEEKKAEQPPPPQRAPDQQPESIPGDDGQAIDCEAARREAMDDFWSKHRNHRRPARAEGEQSEAG